MALGAILSVVGGLIGRRADKKADQRAQADADRRAREDQVEQDRRIAEANANADRRTAEANAREDARTAAYNADMDRRTSEANAENDRRHARDQLAADTREAQNREVQLEDRTEQRQYNEGREASRFTDLRDAAVAAGFNPLTALQNNFLPGMEAGLVSSGVAGAIGSPAPLTFNSPMFAQHAVAEQMYSGVVSAPLVGRTAQSMGSIIGGALPGLTSWATGQDARDRETQALQNDVLRLDADRSRAILESGVETSVPSSGGSWNGGASDWGSGVATGQPGLQFGGRDWGYAQDTTDTQAVEDRYGDVAGAVYGAGVAVRDAIHNWGANQITAQLQPWVPAFSGWVRDSILGTPTRSSLTAFGNSGPQVNTPAPMPSWMANGPFTPRQFQP